MIAQEAAFESQEKQVVARVREVAPSFNWEDWDCDIFWCASSGDVAKRQATLITNQLKEEGAKGRIRVRELPSSVNARAGYQISGYAIRRNRNEARQAEALKGLAETVLEKNRSPADFRIGVSTQNTP